MLGFGLLAAFAVVALAAAVSGLIGFGLALVAVPLLLLFFEPVEVVVIVSFISLFTNLVIVQDFWREVEIRSVLALMPWAIGGLIVGTEILRSANPDYIRLGVGGILVVSAVLLLRNVALKSLEGRLGTALAGASSGALATSTGIAGPPIVLLFADRGLPKDSFRVSNAAYFLLLGVAIIFTFLLRGIVDSQEL
ncbi:MAG: sulfite exporter TauE/SafE family protein [Rubrobacteraceae bacterium]